MALLSDADRDHVSRRFAELPAPVHLVFFNQAFGCETCADTKRIVDEVASLGPNVTSEELNLVLDKERAAAYGVDRAPTIALVRTNADGSTTDPGIRFVGVPAGYEFMSLLDAIELVASGESGLSADTKARLAALTEPVTVKVFSTPT
jgi:hypothetical protein